MNTEQHQVEPQLESYWITNADAYYIWAKGALEPLPDPDKGPIIMFLPTSEPGLMMATIFAVIGGIDRRKLFSGKLGHEGWRKLQDAVALSKKLNLIIHSGMPITSFEMGYVIGSLTQSNSKPHTVVIDYDVLEKVHSARINDKNPPRNKVRKELRKLEELMDTNVVVINQNPLEGI